MAKIKTKLCLHSQYNPATIKFEGRTFFCECNIVNSRSKLAAASELIADCGKIITEYGNSCCLMNDRAYLGKGHCDDCKKAESALAKISKFQKEG